MIQKKTFYITSLIAGLLLAGCGNVPTNSTQKQTSLQRNDNTLNEQNYFDIARYYYVHELMTTSVHKKRSFLAKSDTMTHIQRSQPKKQKNVFYIKSVKSPQGYLHFLKINYNDQTIEVNADKSNKNIFHLTYLNPQTNKVITKDYSFDELTTVHEGEIN